MMNEYVLTFNTQLDAIIAKKYCDKAHIQCKLAPVPRCLSSSCGTCAFIKVEDVGSLSNLDKEEIFINNHGEYKKL